MRVDTCWLVCWAVWLAGCSYAVSRVIYHEPAQPVLFKWVVLCSIVAAGLIGRPFGPLKQWFLWCVTLRWCCHNHRVSAHTGKSTMLKALAAREVPIPEHIDMYLLDREMPASDKTSLQVGSN